MPPPGQNIQLYTGTSNSNEAIAVKFPVHIHLHKGTNHLESDGPMTFPRSATLRLQIVNARLLGQFDIGAKLCNYAVT